MKTHPKDKYARFKRGIKTSQSVLKKRLDTVFSKFIRLRDRFKIITHHDLGFCSTCHKVIKIKGNHAGHFMIRDRMNTRWDEQNSHLQCIEDNSFKAGKQYEMGKYIDKKYGEGTADKLLIKSKIPKKYQNFEIEAMIKFYRRRVKEME